MDNKELLTTYVLDLEKSFTKQKNEAKTTAGRIAKLKKTLEETEFALSALYSNRKALKASSVCSFAEYRELTESVEKNETFATEIGKEIFSLRKHKDHLIRKVIPAIEEALSNARGKLDTWGTLIPFRSPNANQGQDRNGTGLCEPTKDGIQSREDD